jgi:hypothetical protein
MADIGQPAGQSAGQALGDLFGQVNRPALNSFVANSQAHNGLVSAQTQDAMIKATQAQEQMQAWEDLVPALRNAGYKESDAQLARVGMVASTNHDSETALKFMNLARLGSPTSTPEEQTQAQQGYEGKVAPLQSVPNNFAVPFGQPPPNIQQSPEGVAQTAATNATAGLTNVKADAGGFAPHAGASAAPMDPNALAFGSYMLYKTGKMPSLGMGAGPARSAILAGAAQLAQQEASGQPVTNPGFDTALANGQDFTGAGRAVNSFAAGPLGNQARSINNVTGHIQLMENLFTGLQNGDVQITNKLGAQWKKAFGSEVPTDIQTASSFIGPELTKILSSNGSTGTAEERQEFSNTAANLANSPEQTQGAISTLKNMLGRQLTDMAMQYHGATGRSDFAKRYVAPDVAQYLEVAPEGGPPQAPNGAPAPASTSPAISASPAGGNAGALPPQALAQLKDGLHTTFGNGQVWTLSNGKPVRVQ